MFPVVIGPRKIFTLWREIYDDPVTVERVKWAQLKKPQRTIEKCLRSYKGNVSQLTDLCRQSIGIAL